MILDGRWAGDKRMSRSLSRAFPLTCDCGCRTNFHRKLRGGSRGPFARSKSPSAMSSGTLCRCLCDGSSKRTRPALTPLRASSSSGRARGGRALPPWTGYCSSSTFSRTCALSEPAYRQKHSSPSPQSAGDNDVPASSFCKVMTKNCSPINVNALTLIIHLSPIHRQDAGKEKDRFRENEKKMYSRKKGGERGRCTFAT